jgi:hypothetical protein
MYKHAKTLGEYFWQRVINVDGCWAFDTAGDKNGYPQVQSSAVCKKAKITRAHQLSYVIHFGPIPDDKIVCHICDHPWCVNPNHLFLGTWNDNVQDMMAKRRYKHPTEVHQMGKLTELQKKDILTRKGKQTSYVVAKEFNVSFSRICQLWRGE